MRVSKPFGAEWPALLGHEAGHDDLPVPQESKFLYQGVYVLVLIELLGPDIQATPDVPPLEVLIAHVKHAGRLLVLPAHVQIDQHLLSCFTPCTETLSYRYI